MVKHLQLLQSIIMASMIGGRGEKPQRGVRQSDGWLYRESTFSNLLSHCLNEHSDKFTLQTL